LCRLREVERRRHHVLQRRKFRQHLVPLKQAIPCGRAYVVKRLDGKDGFNSARGSQQVADSSLISTMVSPRYKEFNVSVRNVPS